MPRKRQEGAAENVTTSIKIPKEDMEMVSTVAYKLGFRIMTGGGHGRPGNVSGLLRGIAAAMRRDEGQTLALLKQALAPKPEEAGDEADGTTGGSYE